MHQPIFRANSFKQDNLLMQAVWTGDVQGQCSTVDSKRRQMLLLDEAVYHVKMDFNKRFLALREVKKRVCQQVAEVQGRLREALTALGKPTALVVDPVLKPEEVPELRDQVTYVVTGVAVLQGVPWLKVQVGRSKARQQTWP